MFTKALMKSRADVIADFEAAHGNKFDYSKVVYTGMLNPITVTCPAHGDFETCPKDHQYSKFGCSKCARNATISSIEQAQTSVGFKILAYYGRKNQALFTCREHGNFSSHYTNMANGQNNCPICAGGSTERFYDCERHGKHNIPPQLDPRSCRFCKLEKTIKPTLDKRYEKTLKEKEIA